MIAPTTITATGVYRINSDGENPGPAILFAIMASPTFSGSWTVQVLQSSAANTYSNVPFLDRLTGVVSPAGTKFVGSKNIELSGNNYRAYFLNVTCNIGSLTVQPVVLGQATPAVVKTPLANLDLTQGVPVGYPEDLAFQLTIAANNQGS